MKTKLQKSQALKEVATELKGAKMTVFTSYAKTGEKGLNVGKMRELKKGLAGIGGQYAVVKKTILDRALKLNQVKDVDVFKFNGSLGLVLGTGDEALTAKTVYGFARTNPALKMFGALFSGRFIDSAQFTELAKLPAKEVMIGRAVGMIKYPLSGLMNALQGNIRNLVIVLSAIKSNK